MGYSTAHWEGDTFVVETAGLKDNTWLDLFGHPATGALRVTERFHRRDVGNMDVRRKGLHKAVADHAPHAADAE
jgi:hypothetical protein